MSDRSGGGLTSAMYGQTAVAAVVDDRALLRAMLAVEGRLASACGRAGLIPEAAATEIQARADQLDPDPASIGERAAAHATPVIPLVDDLRAGVSDGSRDYVHFGATSQDILDTALCLIAARALDVIGADLIAVADRLAGLAADHAATVQIGRTLHQHARPTTFGLVCAGWLSAVDEARRELRRVRDQRLAVQLGGPVGTREGYRGQADEVAADLAAGLGLADPGRPWHTDRSRIGALAAAIALAAAALATVARNVVLLSATDIGELHEASPGGSSSMPHKRNPARATLVLAATSQVPGLVAGVLAGLPVEEQRPAGSWQAEMPAVRQLLLLLGGAARTASEMLGGLAVDTARMERNRTAAGAAGGAVTDNETMIASARTLVDRALAAHARYPGGPDRGRS